MKSVECSVWSVEGKVSSAECEVIEWKVRGVKREEWSVACKVESVECGV